MPESRQELQVDKAMIKRRMKERYKRFLAAQKKDAVAIERIDDLLVTAIDAPPASLSVDPAVLGPLTVDRSACGPLTVSRNAGGPLRPAVATSWFANPQTLPRASGTALAVLK